METTFVVRIRHVSNVDMDSIKNLIESKHEVVDIKDIGNTSVIVSDILKANPGKITIVDMGSK